MVSYCKDTSGRLPVTHGHDDAPRATPESLDLGLDEHVSLRTRGGLDVVLGRGGLIQGPCTIRLGDEVILIPAGDIISNSRPYAAAMKAHIIEMHAADPTLTSAELAHRAGASVSIVYLLTKSGHVIPPAGRPSGPKRSGPQSASSVAEQATAVASRVEARGPVEVRDVSTLDPDMVTWAIREEWIEALRLHEGDVSAMFHRVSARLAMDEATVRTLLPQAIAMKTQPGTVTAVEPTSRA